jgi:hypothetical protein
VSVPVIASLNGRTAGIWLRYAPLLHEAGADALELNIYELAADAGESAAVIEDRLLSMVRTVRANLSAPLAVKLSPYYSSLPSLARRLEEAGVDGLVLFNRFYQPDIDIEALEVASGLELSSSADLPLRLTWLAVLSASTGLSLAASGGVHSRHRRRQGGHGRCARGSDGLCPVAPRRRTPADRAGSRSALARGARVRLAAPDAGQHEPGALSRSERLRTLQLCPRVAELALGGGAGGPRGLRGEVLPLVRGNIGRGEHGTDSNRRSGA